VRRNYLLFLYVPTNEIWIHSELFGSVSIQEIPKLQFSEQTDETPSNIYRSPMTGKIVSVLVKPNDPVKTGDILFIIESMKMETKVVSLRDGEVEDIYSSAQALIEEGQKVVSLK
jgi:biotin carboxyl carrier protein